MCVWHPNYTKINFHLFHLTCDLIFHIFLRGSTSTITHSKDFSPKRLLMMSTVAFLLLVPSAAAAVYNSTYTESAALEITLWYRISQWFDCKSSVVTRKIYKERAKREEIKIFSFLRSWRYRRSLSILMLCYGFSKRNIWGEKLSTQKWCRAMLSTKTIGMKAVATEKGLFSSCCNFFYWVIRKKALTDAPLRKRHFLVSALHISMISNPTLFFIHRWSEREKERGM